MPETTSIHLETEDAAQVSPRARPAAPPTAGARPAPGARRVLHIHPKIGIGGVETYLCRLLAELQRRGHQTGLLTSGGVYEERITAAGARLFKLPIRKESLDAAYEMVKPHGFELVHSHNYRASRLGRRLAERLGVPFVMSVHGPRPVWHRVLFRDWSPWVVAMSEGDRDNITSLGGISRDRVLLSFYGIDTDRFRPGVDTSLLRAELGLPRETRPIALISRFAHEKADIALELIEAMPRISATIPQTVLLLVGEGPERERLAARGEEMNRRTGEPLVRMLGPRQDVECVMNLANVVVATANTALEAMACAVPTIATGRSGYLGEVTPDTFEEGRAVCFGDHGRLARRTTYVQLAEEIRTLLAGHDAALAVAQANRAVIEAKYNIACMGDSIEAIYAQVAGVRS